MYIFRINRHILVIYGTNKQYQMQKDPLKEQSPTPVLPLDEKDKAILRYLQTNAKATVREIAAKVHLSTTPVHERIKRMEEEGVILQYATIPGSFQDQ